MIFLLDAQAQGIEPCALNLDFDIMSLQSFLFTFCISVIKYFIDILVKKNKTHN